MPRKKEKARKLYYRRFSKKRLSGILGNDIKKLTIKGSRVTNKETIEANKEAKGVL